MQMILMDSELPNITTRPLVNQIQDKPGKEHKLRVVKLSLYTKFVRLIYGDSKNCPQPASRTWKHFLEQQFHLYRSFTNTRLYHILWINAHYLYKPFLGRTFQLSSSGLSTLRIISESQCPSPVPGPNTPQAITAPSSVRVFFRDLCLNFRQNENPCHQPDYKRNRIWRHFNRRENWKRSIYCVDEGQV